MTYRLSRMFCALAAGVLSILFSTSLTPVAPAYSAQLSSTERTITIPEEFFKNESDAPSKKRFDEVLKKFARDYWRVLSAEEVFQKMITGGITSFDPHTRIMNAEEYAERTTEVRGEFGGVGMEVQPNTEGVPGLLVVSPIDDTPAARAGIKPRDIVVKIDGKATAGIAFKESVKMLRGRPGTPVVVTIFRTGAKEPLSFTLTREVIRIQYVKHELKENDIGYIRVTSFGEGVGRSVFRAVKELEEKTARKKLSGLVLDLRNNPGGLLVEAERMSDLFLSQPPSVRFSEPLAIISTERRGTIISAFDIDDAFRGEVAQGVPLVVLVNEGSASASEVVAKALQVYGRATVAGPAKTFGKGTVQGIIELETGGALALTVAQYLIGPEGCEQAVQNVGVVPDIFIKDDEKASLMVREEELQDTIARSGVSSEKCAYTFTLPAGHRETARTIVEKMGYAIVSQESER